MTFQDTEQQGIEKETKMEEEQKGRGGYGRAEETGIHWSRGKEGVVICRKIVSFLKLGQACLFVFALQNT